MAFARAVVAGGAVECLESSVRMTEQTLDEGLVVSCQDSFDGLRHVTAESPCPYLDARKFRSEVYAVSQLDGAVYERLLARGYRRSGRVVYRPRCRGCAECRQIRVPVREFVPTKSMRRVLRRNQDVRVAVQEPVVTEQKYQMYCRYLDGQHDSAMSRRFDDFCDFLYESPMKTWEFEYLLGERPIGVGIVDRCPDGLSSVYMYFDPELRERSLGTLSILREIEYCRDLGLSYYYMGYYVAESKTMAYKARFRPNLILVGEDRWVSLRE